MPQKDIERITNLADRFREFHRLSLVRHRSYADLYAEFLRSGRRMFDMPVGIVSQIEHEQYTILAIEPYDAGLAAGDVLPLGQTYCSRVIEMDSPVAVTNAGRDSIMQGHPAYRQLGLESYIAAPIRVNGRIHGTLNFSSAHVRGDPFDYTDVELIELMAGRLGQIIEQDLLDRERQEALRQLRENTELFESAFEYAAIGMGLVSPQGRWIRVNQAVTSIFGYSESELMKLDFQTLTHPDDLDADLEYVREMLSGKRDTYRMQKRYFHKDGHEIWALLSVSLVRDEQGEAKYFVSQIQDITNQKRAETELRSRQRELESLNRKLEQLSTTDALTQLANRRALENRMHEELHSSARTGQPLSVLLVDIDHFKHYNDTYGHPEGDVALRRLGEAMQEVARVNDVVARLGGEEFTLLLPHTDEQGCRTVAKRLANAVSALEGLEAPITVSTGGVTLIPAMRSTEVTEMTLLMKRADEALYRAKQEGRNRHVQASSLQG